MKIIATHETGMYPNPKEIKLQCSCPDYASMCKHVAAVLYGVGNRLDGSPEELFILRQTNHMDLVDHTQLDILPTSSVETQFEGDLSALFGIELAQSADINETGGIDSQANVDGTNPKPVKKIRTNKKDGPAKKS
jgi:uncharacterized Zn finger protein